MRICRNCPAEIYRRNRTGLCRKCVTNDPDVNARRKAGLKRTYDLHPEMREAATERLRAATRTPEHAERARKMMTENRLWEKGMIAIGPAGSPSRRKCAATLSNTRLKHIPPELRKDYRRLVTHKGFTAAEATVIITADHEFQMAKWRRNILPVAEPQPLPVTEISVITVVLEAMNLDRAELLSPSRLPILVDARALCSVMLREKGLSYPAIGAMLGRDHSSIMHLVETFPERSTARPELRKLAHYLPAAMAAARAA